MTKIAFIGLGNMGSGMCANLVRAGHDVTAFDLSDAAIEAAVSVGAIGAASVGDAQLGHERLASARGQHHE